MPDKNTDPDAVIARQAGLAPETFNDEQDDEDAQAQTLADEALGRSPESYGWPHCQDQKVRKIRWNEKQQHQFSSKM